MAIPVINNLTVLETGYTGTYRPAVRINFDLYDADVGELVNVDVFKYVKASNYLGYSPSNITYFTNWNLTNTYYDDVYVKFVRQGTTDSYTVELYSDAGYTLLVASGSGSINNTITLTQSNSSGVSGTVYKNATQLGFSGEATLTLTDNTVWNTGTIVTGTQSLNGISANTTSPGRATTLYWDIVNNLGNNINETYYFKIRVIETDSPFAISQVKGSGPFNVLLQTPVLTLDFPSYTNLRTFQFVLNYTGTATLYRAAETQSALSSKTWTTITDIGGVKYGSLYFTTSTQENKTIWVEISDAYYNRSTAVSDIVNYHTQGPENLYLKINGSSGSSDYTGVFIEEDGSFALTDEVELNVYATDLTSIQMYIDGNVKNANNVRTWIPYSNIHNVHLSGSYLGGDTSVSIQVSFKDEAGNITSISENIRYNTKVYRFGNNTQGYHQNLREPDSAYAHQIMETTGSGGNIVINATEPLSGEYVRKWEDIFYPLTHRYPVNPDGTINTALAISMNGVSNALYDAVYLVGGQISYDSEGRVTTVDWKKDGTKNYENLESSYSTGLRNWVIDNTGYGDFILEFEHFYLDPNSYGPPYNNMAPYDGDSLVIYDASADGCVQELTGAYGTTEYVLADSSKLVELLAYTGSGSQVYSLTTGRSVNANVNGGFTVPEITTTSRICIVLYTDASVTSSGFKLKAGKKHDVLWENYDVDELNGQLWIHKYPIGNAPTTEVRAIYDYYDARVTYDYDAGTVTFDTEPNGNVTADYTYYEYNADERPASRLFSFYNDDFVDYLDVDIYVAETGIIPPKDEVYIHDYPNATHGSGKVTQYFTVDKDRGMLEFSDATVEHGDEFGYIPKGRIFGDYRHHTYLRLSNDGYGDFTFYDDILVADTTTQYPDYTFADMKLVNEGDAILEDGKMRFLPRGYDTNGDGTVDQVLDINRPWDVQAGSAAETYQKTAAEIREQYTWSPTCTKNEATSILSSWQNRVFGFDVFPEQVFYARAAWVLGGTSGTSYPTTTTGGKAWSSSIEGKFYSVET